MPHKPRSTTDLPSTLARSPVEAQRLYSATLKHAREEYGDEARAHRTAFASLKRQFEKVDDHWAPKASPDGPAKKR